jgi:hypothetical protein
MTGFGRRALLTGALTIAVAPITGIAVAGTAAAPHFGPTVSLKLPLNAGRGVPLIESASCVSTGSCTVAGSYPDSSSVGQVMAVTESGGHWARATKLTLPANRGPRLGALARSVSCTRVGSCVAVGDYETSSSHVAGFAATESHGTWNRATQVRLPTNAAVPSDGFVAGVSCTGPGSCVLAGNYADNLGHARPMVATEVRGTWARARELRAPANAGSAGQVLLLSVACPKAGSCVAVGTFDDKTDHARPMAVTESGGRWHQAIQIVLPKDAAGQPQPPPSIPPMSVACSGAGNCLFVSSYRNRLGRMVPMSAAESNGTWRRAQHITRALANSTAVPFVTLSSVACMRTGTCTASGDYALKSGGFGALVMTRTGTRWTSATQIRAPADAATGDRRLAVAAAIGCTATGFCAIGGTYRTASSTIRAMAATG